MNREGGTASVLYGNLKRRIVSAGIVNISPGENDVGTITITLVLRGLCDLLKVFVGCGAYQADAFDNLVPLRPVDFPAGVGTIQITPQTNFPDRPKIQGRPVFQDPTFSDNQNHPLPQGIPFFWNMPGECDEAVIDLVLDKAAWAGSGITAQLDLQVMVEYVGPWWDAEAYKLAMGQVQLDAPTKPLSFFS